MRCLPHLAYQARLDKPMHVRLDVRPPEPLAREQGRCVCPAMSETVVKLDEHPGSAFLFDDELSQPLMMALP